MLDARAQLTAAIGLLASVAEDRMVDTCTVSRPAQLPQTPALDGDGNPTEPDAPTVYDGPCTIAKPTAAQITGRTVNDQSGVPNLRVLKVPHGADIRPGDLVTVTAPAFAPGLTGDRFVVLGEEEQTFAAYRRFTLRGSSWESTTTGA